MSACGFVPPSAAWPESPLHQRLHDTRTAASLGVALGVAFGLCFATGVSRTWPSTRRGGSSVRARPAGLYRITQGVHVLTGIAAIPFLLAKLWVVHPRLVDWPPARSVAHAVERLALLPLVGGGLFLLLSGVANVARWYPWRFFFPRRPLLGGLDHHRRLIVHVGAKAAATRDALRARPPPGLVRPPPGPPGFLGGVAARRAAGAGDRRGAPCPPLDRLSVLAQRRPGVGPQGLPVNKTAAGARVRGGRHRDPGYRLRSRARSRRALSLPGRPAGSPPAGGHPADRVRRGLERVRPLARVPVRDLLALAGAGRRRRRRSSPCSRAAYRPPSSTATSAATATPCSPWSSTARCCTSTTATRFA